jgi:hypothetical protein
MILSVQEKVVPGFKASKYHCTLLLDGNTSGDYKIKPLVYHSENPQAHVDYSKGVLPVLWQSNNAWIIAGLFQCYFAMGSFMN